MKRRKESGVLWSVGGLGVFICVGLMARYIVPRQFIGSVSFPFESKLEWNEQNSRFESSVSDSEIGHVVVVRNGSLTPQNIKAEIDDIEPRQLLLYQSDSGEPLFEKTGSNGYRREKAVSVSSMNLGPGDELALAIIGKPGDGIANSAITSAYGKSGDATVLATGEWILYASFMVVLCIAVSSPTKTGIRLLLETIPYCRTGKDWENMMSRNWEGAVNGASIKGQVDFGIITVREDEFLAVLERFEPCTKVGGGRRTYFLSCMVNAGGTPLTIAIVRCPEQGQGMAQAVAADMIHDLKPRWLLVVGIAGALPDTEFTLGDVVVSNRVHDFCISAALQGGDREYDDMGGPLHQSVEDLLACLPGTMVKLSGWNSEKSIGRLKPQMMLPESDSNEVFYGDAKWRKSVFECLAAGFPSTDEPRLPLIKIGGFASSNVLVKDADLARQWKESARSVCAIEMELAGIYRAARYSGNPDCRVLAIRGISDIVGYRRSPEWTKFACHAAAAFCKALIESRVVEIADLGKT